MAIKALWLCRNVLIFLAPVFWVHCLFHMCLRAVLCGEGAGLLYTAEVQQHQEGNRRLSGRKEMNTECYRSSSPGFRRRIPAEPSRCGCRSYGGRSGSPDGPFWSQWENCGARWRLARAARPRIVPSSTPTGERHGCSGLQGGCTLLALWCG